jgi:acetyl-CoA carboxylase biotin carboxyl carrier protein
MDDALEELIAIVELLKDADFTQFRYQQGDFLVEISRGEPLSSPDGTPRPAAEGAASTPPSPVTSAAPSPPADAGVPFPSAAQEPTPAVLADTAHAVTVEAPMLGTFYRSPKPGEPSFVQLGDEVTPDTVLCIVEVMKLMNSVTAGVAGTVVEVSATDGQLVELGTPLFRINPAE